MSSDREPMGGMFRIVKTLEFAASHRLHLPYDSPCNRLHGHNYTVEIEVAGPELNEQGMLIDFSRIKGVVMALDHRDLNETLDADNPTAERIAFWIADGVQDVLDMQGALGSYVESVSVRENDGNEAIWER